MKTLNKHLLALAVAAILPVAAQADVTVGIITASLIIGSSIVMSVDAGPKIFGLPFFGFVGYVIAFFNSVWMLWSLWRAGKH